VTRRRIDLDEDVGVATYREAFGRTRAVQPGAAGLVGSLNEPATETEETGGAEAGSAEAEDIAGYDEETHAAGISDEVSAKRRVSPARLAAISSLLVVVVLAGLTGWLGVRTYQSDQAGEQHKLFLQVGWQAALNLTTIDWQEADRDVQRILDSATGTFHDDFQQRSQPFVDVVKRAQSKSVGTITEAGLESESGNDAQVLVAV
jgi:Mce-associated membrane protein